MNDYIQFSRSVRTKLRCAEYYGGEDQAKIIKQYMDDRDPYWRVPDHTSLPEFWQEKVNFLDVPKRPTKEKFPQHTDAEFVLADSNLYE